MIEKIALKGDAPLYGRRTSTLKLQPLKFTSLQEWFQRYSLEELVKIYGAFGGTPTYLEYVDESLSVEENIVKSILNRSAPLYNEPEYFLMEELRHPQRYLDILYAISKGRNSLSEISDLTKISRENLTTYPKSLMELDLVSRVYPSCTEQGEDYT